MNGELSFNSSNHSQALAKLKSRYSYVHEPLALDAAAAAAPDDERYLTSLWVFEDREENEPDSPLPPSFSKFMDDQNIIDPHIIKEKIASALKDLKFREEHVLVQFWSPVVVKRRWLLVTWDQPFGLGVLFDKNLSSYRKKSERYAIVADGEHRENLSPPGRVYSQKMPEWSLDVNSQLDTCSYNIYGYINLPVFESSSDYCVGVLEIVTSSRYVVDFAFEVHQVWRALKDQNLKSPNVFDHPSFSVSGVPSNLISLSSSVGALKTADDSKQHELEIFNVLKTVCDVHNLPLAQTWAPSAYNSYVAISETLDPSCSSFNKSCIGKACLSTAGLPFYVRDLSKWGFHEACQERHLDISQGVVGRSLSSYGTWLCKDVTELDENNYPLVHYARISRLTSCLAIYLKSLEPDACAYVIEFFLPTHNTNETVLRRLMETVNQHIKNTSWMQIDIISPPQVIGEVSLNWYFESSPSLLTEKGEVPPSESENIEMEPSNSVAGETSQSVVPYFESGINDVAGIKPIKSKRKRKRPERLITEKEIKKHFGKTMDEAAAVLKVSRSTLKRICRNLGIPRWPYKNAPERSDSDALMRSDKKDVIVHNKFEGSLTPTLVFGASNEPIGGTTYTTHDPTALTENGKPHNSTNVSNQHEQANLPDELLQPETTIKGRPLETRENVTIKATYKQNTVKFTYRLLDGLEKLKELIATRFPLKIESFRLKYLDEDGDMILIACENDLLGSSTVFSRGGPGGCANTIPVPGPFLKGAHFC